MATPAADPGDGGTITHNLRVLVGVIAPTTILTALFLYFGYLWTDSFYEYFGVDAATLQFSPQDYMLRSVQALYVPVGALLLIGLIFTWAQPSIVVAVLRHRHARWWRLLLRVLVTAGLALVVVGGVFVVLPGASARSSMMAPLCIAAGVLLLSYCRSLAALRRRGRFRRAGRRERISAGLILAVVTLCVFWSANSFAQQYGRGMAIDLGGQLWLRPAVTLDTTEELFLQMPGVSETALPNASKDQNFHFRYRGLRLLAQSGNRMFLISTQWSPPDGRALMLSDGSGIRIQFGVG